MADEPNTTALEALNALADWYVEKHWQQSFEDIAIWGAYVTKDGERVDPATIFTYLDTTEPPKRSQ